MAIETGVHRTHCCAIHGCKYGEDETCPVVIRDVVQDYLCEDCGIEGIRDIGMLDDILAGSGDHCPHCPHCGGIL